MLEEIKKLSPQEQEAMMNAPVWVTLLIAGADSQFDRKEIEEAVAVTQLKNKRARKVLIDYYTEINKSFESNLKGYIALLPEDVEKRTKLLIENLEKLNEILPKMDKNIVVQFHESLKDLAKKVAESSGGFMGFLSVGYEESKLVGLKMIKDPSK